MSSSNFIQRQYEIIQSSYSVIKDNECAKNDIETRFKRDREAAENNWSYTKAEADNAIIAIREAMRSTQEALYMTKWGDSLLGGTPNVSKLVKGSSFDNRMAVWRARAEMASMKVQSLLTKYESLSKIRDGSRLLAFILGIIACFIEFYIITVTSFDDVVANHSALILTVYLTLIITFVFIYFTVNITRTKSIVSKLKNAHSTLSRVASIAEDLYHQEIVEQEKIYQQQMSEIQTRRTELIKPLDQKFAKYLSELQSPSATLVHDVGFLGTEWNDSQWKQWSPTTATSSFVRIGTLTPGVHKELPAMPALITSPGGENVLFKTAGTAKTTATKAIQALILRLLATQPPGSVRFTFIDPVGLGQNVEVFMQLVDYDRDLVTQRAWTEPRHIEQQLMVISEHMATVIQEKLRGRYSTIGEYNQRSGQAEVAYWVVVVMDFPSNFTVDTARRLVNIAKNGPRCGVSTVVMLDTEQPRFQGFNFAELEQVSTVIAWNGQRFVWGGVEK